MKLVTRKSECRMNNERLPDIAVQANCSQNSLLRNCIIIKKVKYVSKDKEILEFSGVTNTDNSTLLLINHQLLR